MTEALRDGELDTYLYTYTEAPTEFTEVESRCIWGTTVNIEESTLLFSRFFAEYRGRDGGLVYPVLLQNAILTGSAHLSVDCSQIAQFEPTLYRQLISYPTDLLPIADISLHNIVRQLIQGHESMSSSSSSSSSLEDDIWKRNLEMFKREQTRLQLRVFRLARIHSMRELNPVDVDTLISVKGMVTRVSPIIPELKQAYFECERCKQGHMAYVERGWVTEPAACSSCRVRGSIRLVHNRCVFGNKQLIKLQETPDAIPEGETPNSVNLFVFDDLVDAAIPGDRVVVTGVFRASPVRKSPTQRSLNTLYRTYLDVIHVEHLPTTTALPSAQADADTDRRSFARDDSRARTEETKDDDDNDDGGEEEDDETLAPKMRAIAADPDLLVRSFCPSIYENADIKKALLCQLFGGVPKIGKLRGDINILLVGDPGTAKSQLLQYVHKLAPRGIYTSGKGSSAVGLTAYVTRDPDTSRAVLESGALVLSDGGICCIDEFDKMSDQTRSILHEAMEQQTVSVAKAGIICTLNARTAILAAANPRESRYNPRLSVVDNIQLDPPLLSRFDLIFLVLDNPNPKTDRRLAAHIVSLFFDESEGNTQAADEDEDEGNEQRSRGRGQGEQSGQLLSMRTLSRYIAYAKRTCKPVLSDEAVAALSDGYVEMRKLGVGRKTITATPRQLESTIRISEALAKMRLSEHVTREDVEEALRLLHGAMQRAAMDPRTGTIDMDLITTGRSAYSRAHNDELKNSILACLRERVERGTAVSMRSLMSFLKESLSITLLQSEVRDTLQQMAAEDNPPIKLMGDRIFYEK